MTRHFQTIHHVCTIGGRDVIRCERIDDQKQHTRQRHTRQSIGGLLCHIFNRDFVDFPNCRIEGMETTFHLFTIYISDDVRVA
jgi:hypothetical protein